MAHSTGIAVLGNYAGAANDQARVQVLIDLIPDPDAANTGGSGSIQGGLGFLDELSPLAAAQLRVELVAMKAAIT